MSDLSRDYSITILEFQLMANINNMIKTDLNSNDMAK